jgi:hypothetical protein
MRHYTSLQPVLFQCTLRCISASIARYYCPYCTHQHTVVHYYSNCSNTDDRDYSCSTVPAAAVVLSVAAVQLPLQLTEKLMFKAITP